MVSVTLTKYQNSKIKLKREKHSNIILKFPRVEEKSQENKKIAEEIQEKPEDEYTRTTFEGQEFQAERNRIERRKMFFQHKN